MGIDNSSTLEFCRAKTTVVQPQRQERRIRKRTSVFLFTRWKLKEEKGVNSRLIFSRASSYWLAFLVRDFGLAGDGVYFLESRLTFLDAQSARCLRRSDDGSKRAGFC